MVDDFSQCGWLESGDRPGMNEDDVKYKILSALKSSGVRNNEVGENTKRVKVALVKLGLSLGNKCWTNRLNGFECVLSLVERSNFRNQEWLFDLIWYQEQERNAYCIRKLVMAMECEWNHNRSKNSGCYGRLSGFNDVKYKSDGERILYEGEKFDFQKLVVSNAKLSVMIFKIMDVGIRDFDKYVSNVLDGYKPKLDRSFLCIAYNRGMQDFYYKVFKTCAE